MTDGQGLLKSLLLEEVSESDSEGTQCLGELWERDGFVSSGFMSTIRQ